MNQLFKPSINIKYDFKANDLLEYYIPTPTHTNVLNALCESSIYSKASNNHIVIGAYGTGKSLLGLLSAKLLSKAFDEKELTYLIESFSKYDDNIATNLKKLKKDTITYLPVFINGSEGDFENTILINTIQTLEDNEIEINLNNKSVAIIGVLHNWRDNYPNTYDKFKAFLKVNRITNKEFDEGLKNFDESIYKLFEQAYSELTSGATFNFITNTNFILQLENIFEELEKHGLGLLFIYDEFGRFLQMLPEDKTHQVMQDIQDFAELLSYVKNGRSILISHKDMRNYFINKPQFIDEFQRIEKRFRKHYITTNKNIYFNFAEKIISELRTGEVDGFAIEQSLNNLRKYPILPFNRTELEKIVVQGCYPLHPVALALLQPLSNAFGQNERTLFTFLDTLDTFGLKHHLANNDGLYYAHHLFDFFFPTLDNLSTLDGKYSHLKAYIKNYQKIPKNKDDSFYDQMIQLMKFVTVWQITGLHTTQALSTEFISYATGFNMEATEKALDKLRAFRALRFNRLFNQWEIYEGSSVDIDEELATAIAKSELTQQGITQIIENLLTKKFFTAESYNLKKKMVRFADVRVISDEELESLADYQSTSASDATLFIVILDGMPKNLAKKLIYELIDLNKNYIFCLTNQLLVDFEGDVKRYEAASLLLQDNELLSEDQFVEFELNIEFEETLFYLKKRVKELTSFNPAFDWLVPNEAGILKFRNEVGFRNYLSALFMEQFPLTPIINNEAFNRRKVAGVQTTSAKKVIDAILENPDKENFGITGFGPDYLIFATVFKNNGIQKASDLLLLTDESMKALRQKILETVHSNTNFTTLVDVLRLPPYGLRETVIPVLLAGLLQDVWANLMFYNRGQYISKITSTEFYEMIQNSEAITYQLNHFDETDYSFFEYLNRLFKDFVSEHVLDKPIHIQASSALLGWLQSLPRYTQMSIEQEPLLQDFKQWIRKLEVNPNESLQWLKSQKEQIASMKSQLEAWFDKRLESTNEELKVSLNGEDLANWVQQKSIQIKDNRFLQMAMRCDTSTVSTFLNGLSKQLFEYEATSWTDSLQRTFVSEVKNKIDSVSQIEYNPKEHHEVTIGDEKKYIKKIDLTPRAKTLLDNLERMIDNSGKRITNLELEYILYSIVEKKLKDGEGA